MSINDLNMGSRVRVLTTSLSGPATAGEFKIVNRYPVEGREPMYRLLDIRQRTERMAPESELCRVHSSSPIVDADLPALAPELNQELDLSHLS